MKRVVINLKSGIVQGIYADDDVTVVVRDYDAAHVPPDEYRAGTKERDGNGELYGRLNGPQAPICSTHEYLFGESNG